MSALTSSESEAWIPDILRFASAFALRASADEPLAHEVGNDGFHFVLQLISNDVAEATRHG